MAGRSRGQEARALKRWASLAADLAPPEPLSSDHRVESLDCGEHLLDEWLRKRALGNQGSGASRTFVVADASDWVMAITTGSRHQRCTR